jgi:hypothetical protein
MEGGRCLKLESEMVKTKEIMASIEIEKRAEKRTEMGTKLEMSEVGDEWSWR